MNGITESSSVQAVTLINQQVEGLEQRIRESQQTIRQLQPIKEVLCRNGSNGYKAPTDQPQAASYSLSHLLPKARERRENAKPEGSRRGGS
jgi:hypothetical protein